MRIDMIGPYQPVPNGVAAEVNEDTPSEAMTRTDIIGSRLLALAGLCQVYLYLSSRVKTAVQTTFHRLRKCPVVRYDAYQSLRTHATFPSCPRSSFEHIECRPTVGRGKDGIAFHRPACAWTKT
jgi:hypothetical protein